MIARLICVSAVAALLQAGWADAQQWPVYGDELYQPSLRQAGKDVLWVPTPDALVTLVLRAAKTGGSDLVYDLGSGDGKIAIAAAQTFGAKAVGIEYNPEMAALAKRNSERAGVADRVTIINGDVFKEDFSKATVVTMYLLPELNLRLRPQLLKMKPGTRVVSHQFSMGEWPPDETLRLEHRQAYLWIVPTQVEGRWMLSAPSGTWTAEVNLSQQFQRIEGSFILGNKMQPLENAYIRGAVFGFTFKDLAGVMAAVSGTVDGEVMSGTVHVLGVVSTFTGQRR